MFRALTAIAFCAAVTTTPVLAQDKTKTLALPESGLASAATVGGIALVGVATIIIAASLDDDDDGATATTSTSGT